jgi:hypothetical protein
LYFLLFMAESCRCGRHTSASSARGICFAELGNANLRREASRFRRGLGRRAFVQPAWCRTLSCGKARVFLKINLSHLGNDSVRQSGKKGQKRNWRRTARRKSCVFRERRFARGVLKSKKASCPSTVSPALTIPDSQNLASTLLLRWRVSLEWPAIRELRHFLDTGAFLDNFRFPGNSAVSACPAKPSIGYAERGWQAFRLPLRRRWRRCARRFSAEPLSHRSELGPGFCRAAAPCGRSRFPMKDAMPEAFAAALRRGSRPSVRANRRSSKLQRHASTPSRSGNISNGLWEPCKWNDANSVARR